MNRSASHRRPGPPTHFGAVLIGAIAAVSASALLAAGEPAGDSSGLPSPFDPAPGAAAEAMLTGTPTPERAAYFHDEFPDRGRVAADAAERSPTF